MSLSERAAAAALVEQVVVDGQRRRRALRSALTVEGVVGFGIVLFKPMDFTMPVIVVTIVVVTLVWHLVSARQRRARFDREARHAGFDVVAIRAAVDAVARHDLPLPQAIQRAVKDTDDHHRLRSP